MEDAKVFLKNQIIQAIDNFDYELGEMLAERLMSFDPRCPDAQFLFAKTLYLGGSFQKALSVIDSTTNHPQSIILYGNCCLKLKKHQEGEVSLRRWIEHNKNESVSIMAAVSALIGHICRNVGRTAASKTAYLDSIKYNPFHYTSYIGLSDLGVPLKISDYLNPQKILNKREKQTLSKETAVSKKRSNDGKVIKPSSREPLTSKLSLESRKRGQTNKLPAKVLYHSLKKPPGDISIKLEKENYSVDDLVFIAQNILTAYNALSLYRCKYSLEVLKTIPSEHLNTGFVLSIVNITLHRKQNVYMNYSITNRFAGVNARLVKTMDPIRTKDMDIYATCLWHMKKKVELCILGKELENFNRLAPETLLAEHDSAIEACKRAIQLDPNFTYAHTLLGHEYLANEDLEASMNSFRQAMKTNARHYNAIYGLGLIELKQEKYSVAEHFFKMALEITPENTILLDVLGQSIQKEKTRNEEALALFEKALELAPEHRIYLWHKATLLFEMQRYEDVQKLLQNEILNTKPDTQVLFLLGRTFAKLGLKQNAIKYMTLAQDYQEHKSSSIIKDSIGICYLKLEKLFSKEENIEGANEFL
ncbi:anaphase-promoting complex subunit cdc27 [Boothiomyces sp. JEL0866]|nr:anaphase-promoting complex subunit cdc27 [Boothiomyces sp. JEL0866]